MPSFRFVHAADIHLDSPLKGLAGQEGSAVALIRSAPREAFDALIGRTIEEDARFLIIAGDLYDGDWRDYQTGLFFVRQMARLRDAGIRAYVIKGNHDAASQITRSLRQIDNVKVFPTRRARTHRIPELGVALHGQSFGERDVTENLAREYPDPEPGFLNIGILHTGLESGEGPHARYAPCSLDDLVNKGYDYWALGHIHQPSVRHRQPYVVYSGNIQGRHIGERGPRGAIVVTVEDGDISDVAPCHVDIVRWALVQADAADCDSLQDLFDRVRDGIEAAVSNRSGGRLLACRIVISGETAIHDQAVASREKVLAEARAAAATLGEDRAWVEKVAIQTTPRSSGGLDPTVAELLGDLPLAAKDEALIKRMRDDIGLLASKLPHEVRADTDDPILQAAVAGDFETLIELAGPYAAARLVEGGD